MLFLSLALTFTILPEISFANGESITEDQTVIDPYVEIVFVDAEDSEKFVTGAKIEVDDASGDQVTCYTSTDESEGIDIKLDEEYTVRTVSAAKGYDASKDVRFKMDAAGKIWIFHDQKNEFERYSASAKNSNLIEIACMKSTSDNKDELSEVSEEDGDGQSKADTRATVVDEYTLRHHMIPCSFGTANTVRYGQMNGDGSNIAGDSRFINYYL